MTAKAYQAKRPVALLTAGGVANRTVATTDGVTMALQQVTGGMLGSADAGRVVTKLVAASNAPAQVQAQADYVCDGTADDVEINAALASLGSVGGIVQLSEGTFTLAAGIPISTSNRTLRGAGMGATTLAVVNSGGAPINGVLINVNTSYVEISDLTLDGNKANNASATSMLLLYMTGGAGLLATRVRVANSVVYGLVVHFTAVGAVVRDCVAEGCGNAGFLIRGTATQGTVISGCTARNNAAGGFSTDDGVVLYSDCLAVGNTAHGFSVGGAGSQVVYRSCVAQSNTTIGFNTSAPRTQYLGCRAISPGTFGFQISGAEAQASGCSVQAPTQHGFYITGAATDVLISGCVVADSLAGYGAFCQDAAGKATYVGCRAHNFLYWAFRIAAGEAQIRDCTAYGYAAQSTALQIDGGSRHVIDGCRILNNGGYGIYVATAATHVAVTNNFFSDNGLVTNATFYHIVIEGTSCVVAGNVCRDPGSGNRPNYAITIGANAADVLVGHNDAFGSGVNGTLINNGAANIRYPVKQLAGYTATTDLLNPVSTNMVANQWLTVVTSPVFHVTATQNIIEIMISGSIRVGKTTGLGFLKARIVLDGGPTYMLGGDHSESTANYQNPLAGGGLLKLTGLSVADHTFVLQIQSATAGWAILRAATVPSTEFLIIQVQEYQA